MNFPLQASQKCNVHNMLPKFLSTFENGCDVMMRLFKAHGSALLRSLTSLCQRLGLTIRLIIRERVVQVSSAEGARVREASLSLEAQEVL